MVLVVGVKKVVWHYILYLLGNIEHIVPIYLNILNNI